ncbi:MAG TPA: hypothetical protein VNW90_24485, partial [Acetobacteraceae bacterium]|nr:hypothetical protein [Acetobacteraceae bacterium]
MRRKHHGSRLIADATAFLLTKLLTSLWERLSLGQTELDPRARVIPEMSEFADIWPRAIRLRDSDKFPEYLDIRDYETVAEASDGDDEFGDELPEYLDETVAAAPGDDELIAQTRDRGRAIELRRIGDMHVQVVEQPGDTRSTVVGHQGCIGRLRA